jgi:cytidylate kinase
MRADRPLRIGLTGGIGSGKSTVAMLLVRHGAALIDTDAIAANYRCPAARQSPLYARPSEASSLTQPAPSTAIACARWSFPTRTPSAGSRPFFIR